MPKDKKVKAKSSSTVATQSDGTIQINFTIPYATIEDAKKEVLEEVKKTASVPGFRTGMAPLDKVEANIPENTILEKTLSKLLPNLLGETIDKHHLKLAIYPKFTLIKAQKDEDWQIRAETCEIPTVDLGDYQKTVSGNLRSTSLWTPGKNTKDKKPPTREEKEQIVIKTILENTKVTVPKILLEEEVNARLARLLERIEKLGLSLESYLSSVGKTADNLRSEYEQQAYQAIALELILNKVANTQNIKVSEKEINDAINASNADRQLADDLQTPEKKRLVESILLRRKALDFLTALA